MLWNHPSKPVLVFAERQITQVLTVAGKQVRRIEARLPEPKEQVLALRISAFVYAINVAIQNSMLRAALLEQSEIQAGE